MRKKETFTVDEKEYAILEPSPKQGREAQNVFNQTFAKAVKNGDILRKALDKYAREQGLWSDEQAEEYEKLAREILEKEKALKGGGIKLSDAKQIALEMRSLRIQMMLLSADRDSLDDATVEGQAENARFNYFVSVCLLDNKTGNPVFSSLEDYEENGNTEVAYRAAQILARMIHGLDKNYESSLPENQFLKKFNFVNDELKLVNKDGKLVDTQGRLIDEEGRFIDEDGNFIDANGNPLDDEGDYKIDTKPFLDDDGNPILEEKEEKKEDEEKENEEKEKNEEKPKKKRGRPSTKNKENKEDSVDKTDKSEE